MPGANTIGKSCKTRCAPHMIDLPQVCLKEIAVTDPLCPGTVNLPKVRDCAQKEYIQQPRILPTTKFIPPCPQKKLIDVPKVCLKEKPFDVTKPCADLKPCPLVSFDYEKKNYDLPKLCPKLKPLAVCREKCPIKVPKVKIRNIDCNVELKTQPFDMECPTTNRKDVDICVPKRRLKVERIRIDDPKICPPQPPECVIERINC